MENIETVPDNTSDVSADEGVSENVEENTESTYEDYTIDDLMSLSEEDFTEFTEDANHKGMKPLHQWIKHVPEDVRKHLANFRSSYTRKTQELAAERQALKQELEDYRNEMIAERKTLYDGELAKKVDRITGDETEYDVYDPEGMKKEIERQAAKMLKEMMQPAKEQLAVQQRKMELQKFKTANPEITSDEYRMPVAKMLRDRPELKLEDAFYIVKAKVDAAKLTQEREEIKVQRDSRRSTFKKTSTGRNSTPKGSPKFRNAWEAFQYHKQVAEGSKK